MIFMFGDDVCSALGMENQLLSSAFRMDKQVVTHNFNGENDFARVTE